MGMGKEKEDDINNGGSSFSSDATRIQIGNCEHDLCTLLGDDRT